jgi:hypothetical protein
MSGGYLRGRYTSKAFEPNWRGTIGIRPKLRDFFRPGLERGQLAIFTVDNPLGSIRGELDRLNNRGISGLLTRVEIAAWCGGLLVSNKTSTPTATDALSTSQVHPTARGTPLRRAAISAFATLDRCRLNSTSGCNAAIFEHN